MTEPPGSVARSGVKGGLLPLLITLLLLAIVQIASFFVLVSLLRRHEAHLQLAQTLFTQRSRVGVVVRHTQMSLLGLATSDWDALIRERRAADAVAQAYEQTAQALLRRGADAGMAGAAVEDEVTMRDLKEAEDRWQATKTTALAVFRADHFQLKDNPRMAAFLMAAQALLSLHDRVAVRVDQQNLVVARALAWAQYALPTGNLLLLALLALFIYYRTILPLEASVRALGRSDAEVREARDLLEKRVQQRTAELTQATQALRESQSRLQSILDNTAAVVYVKDLDGRYLLVNRRYEQVFHVSNAEMVGKRDLDLFSPDIVEALQANDRKALQAGGPVQFEEAVPQDDGTHYYVSVKFPLLDDSDRPYAVCGVSTDLTELKRAEDQLRHSQKMEAIGRLSGGIAHDFNNLLTAINGYSELMLGELPHSEHLHGCATEILKAGERAANLTHQLLAYSRKQVLEPKVWDLNAIVADMTRMIRRLIGEDISFVTASSHDVGLVNVDRGQMEQIILNLVVNARDAMPDGGKLTVETNKVVLDESYVATHLGSSPGPNVALSVSDTGRGMAPEIVGRIFEPFFTTKEVGKGTGLGLSVVFGIVKQSGGSISVYSEPGHGTTFRIYFPEADASAVRQESEAEGSQDLQAFGGTETILLVEDEEAVRGFATRVLARLGYEVRGVRNGTEAIEAFHRASEKRGIDLVLTDVVMPVMGGLALAKQLRKLCPAVAVLFMSGYAEQAVAHNGLVRARQDFLHKPFSPLQLARKVRGVLDKVRAAHQPPA